MKNKHIFWLLIDSARNAPSDIDDRGLPSSLMELASDGCFFKNVVTSAPSTLMSVSSMMTSRRAAMMSMSYANFQGVPKDFETLPNVLQKNGYDIQGVIYFKHGREVMSNLFGGMIKRKYIPNGLRHSKTVWTNKDMNNILSQLLKKKNWGKPTFTYLHYNVRVDNNISDIISDAISEIYKKFDSKNCTIIVNSDHGYALPSRNLDSERLKKEGWGHDYLMTNDNILTPLFILDDCVEQKGIDERYYSTLDIAPTILDLLEIRIPTVFEGTSLIRQHREKDWTITDNRFFSQEPSNTSVTLYPKKLIRTTNSHGSPTYHAYNLEQDPDELYPLDTISSNIYNKLFDILNKEDQRLKEFHKSRINISSRIRSMISLSSELVIYSQGNNKIPLLFKEKIQKLYDVEIELIKIRKKLHTNTPIICLIESEAPWDNAELIRSVKKNKNVFFVDTNGDHLGMFPLIKLTTNFFYRRRYILTSEPSYLFGLIRRLWKGVNLSPIEK